MGMKDVVLAVIFWTLAVWLIISINNNIQHKEAIEEYQEMTQNAQNKTEEALDIADTWKTGYKKLQEEHSQALEKIEQLEYELDMNLNNN